MLFYPNTARFCLPMYKAFPLSDDSVFHPVLPPSDSGQCRFSPKYPRCGRFGRCGKSRKDRFCSRPAPPHGRKVYGLNHAPGQWPPPGLHSSAVPSQLSWRSGIPPVYGSAWFGSGLPPALRKPGFYPLVFGKLCCAVSYPGLSDTPAGYRIALLPWNAPWNSCSKKHMGSGIPSPIVPAFHGLTFPQPNHHPFTKRRFVLFCL